MTDTTDIKALREASEIGESSDYMTWPKVDPAKLKRVLDQLEAERQRTAGSEEELHKALHREKAAERKLLAAQDSIGVLEGVIARKEFDSLKGDQVPVAFTAARWLDTRCKLSVWTDRESAVMEIGDNSKVAELYDHPQKPVVLPKSFVMANLGPNVRVKCYSAQSVIAAIEAAGGIVKDGE